MQKLRRLLIDCSFVDFSKQPTGIPRVVLNYIEIGYAWGSQNGIEVVPVVPTQEGLFICRPVPGRGAPASLLAAASVPPTPLNAAADLLASGVAELRAVSEDLRAALSGLLAATLSGAPHGTDGAAGLVTLSSPAADGTKPRVAAANVGTLTRTSRIECGPGDLLFCPAYWHDVDPTLYHSYVGAGAKVVILVHDVLPITFPFFYEAPWRCDFKRNVLAAFRYAHAFCTVSNYTRHGLAELAARERLPVVPLMTTYNGYEPFVPLGAVDLLSRSEVLEMVRELGRYYLMVGSIEPKKGHCPVIQCFEEMWRAGLASNLVIVGRRGWLEQDVVRAIEESPFYKDKLFWFSRLDDYELGQVYVGARALVFASVGEGFGLPMIEATAQGTPVVAYDTPIVSEILGGTARTFADASGLVERIVEMEHDGSYAAAAAAAAAVAWPSWEDYTPRVFDTLRAFVDGHGPLPDVVPLAADALAGSANVSEWRRAVRGNP